MPIDWLTPLFTCCGLPILLVVLIALGVAFARGTSPEGQEWIRRRSDKLKGRGRERALRHARRGFEVDDPQERKRPPTD